MNGHYILGMLPQEGKKGEKTGNTSITGCKMGIYIKGVIQK